jgi:hypothetical protein
MNFEQRRLSLAAMRNRVSAFQIVSGVLVRSPKIYGLGGIHGEKYKETYKLNLNEYG